MDDILKALPVPTAMLAAAVLGLWKALLDERKLGKAEREAKDAEIRALSKELVTMSRGLDALRERHERELARSSSRPPNS